MAETATVRRATAADLPRLKVAFAEAFHDDPVFGWLMPGEARRPARLRRFFGLELRGMALPRGAVWTTPEVSGAAMVMPPGRWRVPTATTLLEGSAFGLRVGHAARLGATMEWRHGRAALGAHYYVRDVGVVPAAQGQGLGTALLRPTLEACDREGCPCYLEATTDRNEALYERLSFRVIEELRVGGCPPLRLMVRAAAC